MVEGTAAGYSDSVGKKACVKGREKEPERKKRRKERRKLGRWRRKEQRTNMGKR